MYCFLVTNQGSSLIVMDMHLCMRPHTHSSRRWQEVLYRERQCCHMGRSPASVCMCHWRDAGMVGINYDLSGS